MRIRDIEKQSKKLKENVFKHESPVVAVHMSGVAIGSVLLIMGHVLGEFSNIINNAVNTGKLAIPVENYDAVYSKLKSKNGNKPYYQIDGIYVMRGKDKFNVFFTEQGPVLGWGAPLDHMKLSDANGQYVVTVEKKELQGVKNFLRKGVSESYGEANTSFLLIMVSISSLVANLDIIYRNNEKMILGLPEARYSEVYEKLKAELNPDNGAPINTTIFGLKELFPDNDPNSVYRIFFTPEGPKVGIEAPIDGLEVRKDNKGNYLFFVKYKDRETVYKSLVNEGAKNFLRKGVTEGSNGDWLNDNMEYVLISALLFVSFVGGVSEIKRGAEIVKVAIHPTEYSRVYNDLKIEYKTPHNPVFVAKELLVEPKKNSIYKVFLTVDGPKVGIDAPIEGLEVSTDEQGNYIIYMPRFEVENTPAFNNKVVEGMTVIKSRKTVVENSDRIINFSNPLHIAIGVVIVLRLFQQYNDVYNAPTVFNLPVAEYNTFYSKLKEHKGQNGETIFLLEGLYANRNEEFKVWATPDGPKVGKEAPIDELPVPKSADGKHYAFVFSREVVKKHPEYFTQK